MAFDTKEEKEEQLVNYIVEVLKDEGPKKDENLYFSAESLFYVEGIEWFRGVLEESDEVSFDPQGRVHLNGGERDG
jgi:hypothetical protein